MPPPPRWKIRRATQRENENGITARRATDLWTWVILNSSFCYSLFPSISTVSISESRRFPTVFVTFSPKLYIYKYTVYTRLNKPLCHWYVSRETRRVRFALSYTRCLKFALLLLLFFAF